MSDGQLDSFWHSLQQAEHRLEAEASSAERDLYRTLYGYKSRVIRLRAALAASGPIARQTVLQKLEGISLDSIIDILLAAVKDIALYYGGSVVLGTALGAGLGSLAGGVGAIPGAGLGFALGVELGGWVMMFLGLKMLAETLIDTIPQAMHLYVEGFRIAWGPTDKDRPDARYCADFHHGEEMAAHRFADGHVLMIIALLTAMVAYLLRGKSMDELSAAIRSSRRLGPKVADWLVKNKDKLLKDERLRPGVRERAQAPVGNANSEQNAAARGGAKVANGPSTPKAASSTWVKPRGWRLPATNGKWLGTPGDSGWLSSNPEVNAITGGKPIPFNKGYPDFSEWSQGSFTFDNLTGTSNDFSLVNQAVAKEYGLPNQTAGQNLLRELELTPHHVEDGETIQLIPTALHSNIPHIGGASILRGGN